MTQFLDPDSPLPPLKRATRCRLRRSLLVLATLVALPGGVTAAERPCRETTGADRATNLIEACRSAAGPMASSCDAEMACYRLIEQLHRSCRAIRDDGNSFPEQCEMYR